jgi:hypothetical protein
MKEMWMHLAIYYMSMGIDAILIHVGVCHLMKRERTVKGLLSVFGILLALSSLLKGILHPESV